MWKHNMKMECHCLLGIPIPPFENAAHVGCSRFPSRHGSMGSENHSATALTNALLSLSASWGVTCRMQDVGVH